MVKKLLGNLKELFSPFFALKDHAHGLITKDGTISGQASKNVVTDSNGKITTEAKPTIPSANATATNIKMNGTQSAGSLTTFAKADHVHPVDTSRAAASHTHDDRYYTETEVNTKLSDYLTTDDASATYQPKGSYLTEHQSLTDYVKTNDSRLSNARTPVFNHIGATSTSTKDLDNYTTGGFYYCNNDVSEAIYIANQPWTSSQKSFFLLVETWGASNSSYIKQTLTYYTTSQTYVRTKKAGSGWNSWIEVTKDTNTTYSADNSTLQLSSTTFSVKDGGITNAKLADKSSLITEYIVGTQTSSTSAWTGKATKITSLAAGQVIYYKLPYASTSTYVTLNLTLADGSTTGAKEVWFWNGVRLNTHYGVNSVIGLVYNGSQWWVINPSSNNTNTSLTSSDYFTSGEALTNQNLIACKKADNKYYKINTLKNTVINISRPLLLSNGNVNANTNSGTSIIFHPWVVATNLNGGTSLTLSSTVYQPVYLEGTAYSNGEFTVSNTPITQTLTSGRFYIMIGVAHNTTGLGVDLTRQTVYYYNGTNLIESVSWNGVVNKPTTFTPSSHTHGNLTNDGKIGSTANLPVITGTNGVLQASSFGTSANTFCQGNDSRLTNARTPTAHTDSSGAYGKATTSVWGHTKLSSATNSTDETMSATPKAVKTAYDLANGKPSLGTTATTAAKGNHTHTADDIGTVDDGSEMILNYGVTDVQNMLEMLHDEKVSYEDFNEHSHSYSSITNKPSYTATVTSSTSGAYKIGSINISGSNVDIYGKDTNTTYTHPNSGVTAGTNYNSNQTPSFGGTFNIPKLTFNAQGHITASANSTVKIPALPTASTSQAGIIQIGTGELNAAAGNHTHSGYASSTHTHDDRYFTETEINTKLNDYLTESDAANTYLTSHNPIDTALSSSSTNAVQNKVVNTALSGKVAVSQGKGNSGKFLKVNSSGNVACESVTIPSAYTHPSYTARTGVPTTNTTIGSAGTFTVSQPVSDATGHITALNTRTYTLPTASTSQKGIIQIGTGATNAAAGNHTHDAEDIGFDAYNDVWEQVGTPTDVNSAINESFDYFEENKANINHTHSGWVQITTGPETGSGWGWILYANEDIKMANFTWTGTTPSSGTKTLGTIPSPYTPIHRQTATCSLGFSEFVRIDTDGTIYAKLDSGTSNISCNTYYRYE